MYNHAPENYKCPICTAINGIENEDTLIKQKDIIYKDEHVTAFISSFFIGKNYGHVIVVPNKHFENLYDISSVYLNKINNLAKKLSVIIRKAYKCEGITILQNNEPAGDQHAFHYHLHIFPRYKNDSLPKNLGNKKLAQSKEKFLYAKKLKFFL